MTIIEYPKREEWENITRRPEKKRDDLNAVVMEVLDNVRKRGDDAVREYERKFDKVELQQIAVSAQEIEEAESLLDTELKESIILAHRNIETFHKAQVFNGKKVQTCDGVTCWQKASPIQKVGLYIPGGTAPLFSTVLMLATPAKIAGCSQIVLCTPPA